MCGLVGFLGGVVAQGDQSDEAMLKRMADTIVHRGPDDAGYWGDVEQRIGFGHRRLSIVDLSPAGHQPMHSASGRYVMVFNGEIYNHLDLRRALEDFTPSLTLPLKGGGNESRGGVAWRGHSDTESLLAGLDVWGIEETIKRSIGMFVIAVWDKQTNTLTLGRDRIGEKPLYYGWQGDTFLFGSELKALRAHPAFKGEIDRNVLCMFLRYNYIPAPYSIYQGIAKLRPGCLLTVSLRQREPDVVTYWSVAQVAEAGVANPFVGTAEQAVGELEILLKDAVRQQMMADVPLGAFLSGGVDSSSVVALMQAQSDRPVKTFTIGFNEEEYNEAKHAKAVAKYLGTDHTELYVTPEEAMAVIPKLPTLYDEPFSDSSQIPTFLVSQLARQHVTVSLSGDGGDELFAGYNRYFWGRSIWERIGRMPKGLRSATARTLETLSPQTWNLLFQKLGPVLPDKIKQRNLGDKLHKLAEILAVDHPEEMYLGLVSHWKDPASVVLGASEPLTVLTDQGQWANLPDFTQRMMYLDTVSYLPDDILVKVDRASMGVSLEARVPFLDHRLVEFAWQIPLSMKIRNGQGKWLLRQVLHKYVPKELIDRPKMGFGIPIDAWLRGPLREWAESLLDEKRLREEGFFNPGPIREKWLEHLSGRRNWQYHLWDVLMFQAWLEQQ